MLDRSHGLSYRNSYWAKGVIVRRTIGYLLQVSPGEERIVTIWNVLCMAIEAGKASLYALVPIFAKILNSPIFL